MQQDRHEVVLEANITNFKNKMKEAQNISKEVGKKISDNTKFNVWQNGVMTLSNGTQLVRKSTEELNQKIEDTGEVSQRAGTEISTAFNKGLKSVKKLTLGFLGARSAFGLFRKYMSEYSSENEVFAQKMQLTTSVIANALAPAFEFFGNIIQYVVIGLARVVELLFGVNILGKTMDNSLKKASKSAKELNDNLSGLDEISNIDQSSDGLATSIGARLEALDNFKKKIEEVKELFKKWGVEDKIKAVKKFLEDLWNCQVMQGIRNLIGNIVDWSIKHPNAVATILGGMALVKLISKIMGTAGGTGLLGLVSNLGILSTMAPIVISISVAYYAKKKIDEWKEETQKEMDEAQEEIEEKEARTKEQIANYINEGNSKELQKFYDNRLNDIDEAITKLNDTYVKVNDKLYRHAVEKTFGKQGLEETEKDLKNLQKDVKELYADFKTLYESGMLSKEQEKTYNNLIKQQLAYADSLGYSKKEIQNLIIEYMNLNNSSQSVINMAKYMKDLGFTQEETTKTLKPYFDELEKGTNNAVSQAKNTKSEINNIFADPVKMKFSADTSAILGSVSSAISNIKTAFSKIGFNVPSYDVGTDYVPRDQLAMVHEGERIIPKKYNNSQYMGNDETNSLLMELNRNVLELANKPSILSVNGKELAKATYSDFQEENSRRGSNMSVRRI